MAAVAAACGNSAPVPAGMVRLDGGEFWMGLDDPAYPDAGPVHRVRVAPFWIDTTEVTNAQFRLISPRLPFQITAAAALVILPLVWLKLRAPGGPVAPEPPETPAAVEVKP